jgi:hypothetical protein
MKHSRTPKDNNHKPKKEWGRKLHLDSGIWRYRVGGGGVQIRNPEGERSYVPYHIILDADPWYLEDDNIKVSILPSDVRKHIQEKIEKS